MSTRTIFLCLAAVGVAACGVVTPRADAPQNQIALQEMAEEVAIADVLIGLHAQPAPAALMLRNVAVVDPLTETISEAQAILVRDGRIAWVGPDSEAPIGAGAVTIDGHGRFAAPGLTDAHVHTESASAWLLNLANGVTTVREMDGFPWMLAARDAVADERLLAPTMYVAGTIINARPLEHYAVVPRDPEAARRIVRDQVACGYDFIKIHNLVPRPMFDAVADEARRQQRDLVGHVPHDIAVAHAISAGMRTMEHLKGFLDDRTLELGERDYALARNADLWITPTLYSWRGAAPAAERAAMLAAPAAQYVPARVRAGWAAQAAQADDANILVQRRGGALSREIVRALAQNGAQVLAGTDAANYPFQTMGFALIDEMQALRAAGLTNAQALRAATVAPAQAFRAGDAFGRLSVGARADIILLADNPLEDVAAYARNDGVMVHGRWFDRAALDAALTQLAAIYADTAPAARDALAARVAAQTEAGFVFNARVLNAAARALRHDGRTAEAARVAALAVAPSSGPCAAILP